MMGIVMLESAWLVAVSAHLRGVEIIVQQVIFTLFCCCNYVFWQEFEFTSMNHQLPLTL